MPPVILGTLLSRLGDNYTVYDRKISYDAEAKLFLYQEKGIDQTDYVDYLDIPEELNIFTMLNMSTELAERYGQRPGWRLALKTNTTRFETMERIFDVSNVKQTREESR